MFYLRSTSHRGRSRGEYPVVGSHAGSLGWEAAKCVQIAESFEAVCRGTVNVDELLYG